MRALALSLLLPCLAQAQWTIQQSNTTADLRGIHAVTAQVAWASGSHGTVLHTIDGGRNWMLCATPPEGEKLDFRGIQAFDAETAIVMSSGTGDLSRLYKTTDACRSWTLILTDPYSPEGFFDAILFLDPQHGILFGDPSPMNLHTPTEYENNFRIRVTADGGKTWGPISSPDSPVIPGNGLHAIKDEGAFAASNSSIASLNGQFWFGTSASRVASRRLYNAGASTQYLFQNVSCHGAIDPISGECGQPWTDFINAVAPLNHTTSSAGIFSICFRTVLIGIAAGGDYLKPNDANGTAALTLDGGRTWSASTTPPHGYRSSVAYNPATKSWITVGPNGTDNSTDDGRNWTPVPSLPGEAADSDRNWNALSLPFVVGPHGRIGLWTP